MTKIDPTLTPAALRARRYRERKRSGVCCLRIELPADDVEALVSLGVLNPDQRADHDAILRAMMVVSKAGYEALSVMRDGRDA